MEILPFIKMLSGTTSRKFIAPRREQRKENNYFSQLGVLRARYLCSDSVSQTQAKISNMFG
jgi:hypothetical protein